MVSFLDDDLSKNPKNAFSVDFFFDFLQEYDIDIDFKIPWGRDNILDAFMPF